LVEINDWPQHRFVEGCAVTPFELILEKKYSELKAYVDDREAGPSRITTLILRRAWRAYLRK